jgi:tripartite ATP-independent transporter DctM subunit
MIEVLLVVVLLLLLLFAGTEVFVSLGIAGVLGIFLVRGTNGLGFVATSLFGQATTSQLLALPQFVLMGTVLAKTPIGKDLFVLGARWLSWCPGGLAVGSIGACTLFSAVSGVSVASVAAIGPMAVPEMLKRGYSTKIAAGSIVSAGALAMLLPTSVPFIIYSAITGVSVSKLFIGGILPGLALAALFSIYVIVRVSLRPELAPRSSEAYTWKERWEALFGVWQIGLLIVVVLGCIYGGVATPTEASAVGAAGAIAIAAFVYRNISLRSILQLVHASMKISVAILLIVACAKIFGDYMTLVRVPEHVADFFLSFNLPNFVRILIIQVLLIVGGMFVDAASLMVITTPVFLPLIKAMGYDPLWYGIVLVIKLESAVITPPIGLNLYTLQSCVPVLKLEDIIKSTIPFLTIELALLVVCVAFPALVLWLPNLIGQ